MTAGPLARFTVLDLTRVRPAHAQYACASCHDTCTTG